MINQKNKKKENLSYNFNQILKTNLNMRLSNACYICNKIFWLLHLFELIEQHIM